MVETFGTIPVLPKCDAGLYLTGEKTPVQKESLDQNAEIPRIQSRLWLAEYLRPDIRYFQNISIGETDSSRPFISAAFRF